MILLKEELPAGKIIRTTEPWNGEGETLQEQLDGIGKYALNIIKVEHSQYSSVENMEYYLVLLRGCPEKVTLIQIDAHADLRDELDGEPYSHACAIASSLMTRSESSLSDWELEHIASKSRVNRE